MAYFLSRVQTRRPLQGVRKERGRCSDLITSDARLDYIARFDWDYVRIITPFC
jgi:hypothetical protein